MIQIWKADEESAKLAYFSGGEVRFTTIDGPYTPKMAHTALLASNDVRTDIKPRRDAQIVWHDGDRVAITEFFKSMVADIQDKALASIVQASPTRTTVYILKYLELLALELGVRTPDQLAILSQESQADGFDQSSLLEAWTQKSGAWVHLIGAIEAAGTTAKHHISQAKDDTEMRAIVNAFIEEMAG